MLAFTSRLFASFTEFSRAVTSTWYVVSFLTNTLVNYVGEAFIAKYQQQCGEGVVDGLGDDKDVDLVVLQF